MSVQILQWTNTIYNTNEFLEDRRNVKETLIQNCRFLHLFHYNIILAFHQPEGRLYSLREMQIVIKTLEYCFSVQ